MLRIIWRHAQAGWALNDIARPLTTLGEAQAQASAQWLQEKYPHCALYSSQATRAIQTAQHYGKPVQIGQLNPASSYETILEGLAMIEDEQAIIVGHLPWVSEAVVHFSTQSLKTYPNFHNSEIYVLRDGELVDHFCP